jgi:16S rRNA (uracil1498-N3)-methyltransferase
MTVHRFFVPDLDREAGEGRLSEEQSRQASRVLRLAVGDTLCVFDGSGLEYDARLADLDKRVWRFEFAAGRRPGREPSLALTVGLALIRNERFDLAVQKLTELGVSAIVPLSAERSVISYADARIWAKRRARIHRIVVEAAEQAERTTLPVVHAPQTVEEFLKHTHGMDAIALVERRTDNGLDCQALQGERQALLVGPAGGWSPAELELIERDARPASLGRLILRSETAAIAGASFLLLAARHSEDAASE